jgi:cell division transport system permease protein
MEGCAPMAKRAWHTKLIAWRADDALLRPAGRGVVSLIAIMTFLAGLTAGAVSIVRDSSHSWRSDIEREITIQLRANTGSDAKAELDRVIDLAKATTGIASVRALTPQETAKLLEPWLGAGADLSAIPVPRLIAVKLARSDANIDGLRKAVTEQIRGASVDDHRGYQGRLVRAADRLSAAGLAALVMTLLATAIAAGIATRGAVTANRAVVEVLHFVGARDRFIAGAFQRHFMLIGLKGAAAGALLAVLPFLLARFEAGDAASSPVLLQPQLGAAGYFQIALLALLIAALVAAISRVTVARMLREIR